MEEKSPGIRVWESYSAAFRRRYGMEPLRNAKANTLCLRLARELGADNAVRVVEYYLSRDDAFYINGKFPLGYCAADAQKLWTEMNIGKEVTMTEARRLEKQSTTRKAIATYLEEQGDAS